jgi:hypothetical protein
MPGFETVNGRPPPSAESYRVILFQASSPAIL